MKVFTSLLLVFFTCADAIAQPNIQWQKSLGGAYHDAAYSITQTSDGGYIVAGVAVSNNGDVTNNHGAGDYWIVKLDGSGNIQWQKSLGGSSADDAYSIQQTNDSGYIVAGASSSNDGDVTGNHGLSDYWVVKLDTGGNIQWQKSLGGSSADAAYSIQQTSDGGYIVAGASSSNDGDVTGNHGLNDYWVVKLDTVGNIQWQRSLGGSRSDKAMSIQQTHDREYIVAGLSQSDDHDVTGNRGARDWWVVKLDTSGNMQWQKSLGGSDYDVASSIQPTSDGGYIVAGDSYSNDGDVTINHGRRDYWVVKLDGNGNIQWQKSFGGPEDDVASSVQQTSDSGYVVVGWSYSNAVTGPDYWAVKLDVSGKLQWLKPLGGTKHDIARCIRQTSDGGYIIAGESNSNDGDVTNNHGNRDYWVVKLECGPIVANPTSTPDSIGAAGCTGTVNASPSGGTPPYSVTWSSGATTNLCAGWYSTTITDANSCTRVDSVLVGSVEIVAVEGVDALQSILLAPNPASHEIVLYNIVPGLVVRCYDMTGRLVEVAISQTNAFLIDVTRWPEGIYQVMVEGNEARWEGTFAVSRASK